MKTFLGAAVLVVVGLSLVSADEFRARIKKVDGDKLHVEKFGKDFKKGDKGEEATLTAASTVKVLVVKKKGEAGEPLPEGLKNEMFTSSKKGVFATVITGDDGKVTEVRVFQFPKKKDAQ